jgi:hypothetical protein
MIRILRMGSGVNNTKIIMFTIINVQAYFAMLNLEDSIQTNNGRLNMNGFNTIDSSD